jgi:hypothetical protein
MCCHQFIIAPSVRNFFIENLQNVVTYCFVCVCSCGRSTFRNFMDGLSCPWCLYCFIPRVWVRCCWEAVILRTPHWYNQTIWHMPRMSGLYTMVLFIWLRESWKCEKQFEIENTLPALLWSYFVCMICCTFRNWASEEAVENKTHAGIGGKVKWDSATRLQFVSIWF